MNEDELYEIRRKAANLVADIRFDELDAEQCEELICFLTREWGKGV